MPIISVLLTGVLKHFLLLVVELLHHHSLMINLVTGGQLVAHHHVVHLVGAHIVNVLWVLLILLHSKLLLNFLKRSPSALLFVVHLLSHLLLLLVVLLLGLVIVVLATLGEVVVLVLVVVVVADDAVDLVQLGLNLLALAGDQLIIGCLVAFVALVVATWWKNSIAFAWVSVVVISSSILLVFFKNGEAVGELELGLLHVQLKVNLLLVVVGRMNGVNSHQ